MVAFRSVTLGACNKGLGKHDLTSVTKTNEHSGELVKSNIIYSLGPYGPSGLDKSCSITLFYISPYEIILRCPFK